MVIYNSSFKSFLIVIGIFISSLSFAQTTTVASGNWLNSAIWSSGTVPGNGTTTVVNHPLTMDGNLSPSGNYTFNAPVTDASGGTNYNLTVNGGGNVNVNSNVSAQGVFTMNGGLLTPTYLTIRTGDTLTIGYPGSTANNTIDGYSHMVIEAGGVLIIYGNLEIEGGGDIDCDGTILIDGNFHADEAGIILTTPSEVTGTGTITTTGTMTSDGASEIYGSTTNCGTSPCSSSTPCSLSHIFSGPQTICSGTTPATITGNAPAGITHQWQKSTTSAFTGFTNISGATASNLTFSAGITSTTWYRRVSTVTASSCVSTSTAVKVTVNPLLPASVSITSPLSTFCSGAVSSITFTATPVNGGSPSYQWKRTRAGVTTNVGTNSATYANSTLQDGDIIFCVMTSTATCATGTPATSNSITISIVAGNGSWSGASSTDWNTVGNWCTSVPTSATDVVLSGGTIRNPLISSGTAGATNNLTINNLATLTVSGRDLVINGNLVINSGGTLAINSNTVTVNGSITVNSGGTLTISNPGALSAKGALTNNGVISGTGILTLNGSALQNVSGTSGTFGNITLDNASGCRATTAITISGYLTLTNGPFDSSGNLTIHLTTGGIAGAGSGSITGDVTLIKSVSSAKYHYLSNSLLSGGTFTDWNDDVPIILGQYNNLYYYDETVIDTNKLVGWTAVSSISSPIQSMKGYAVFSVSYHYGYNRNIYP